MTHRVAILCLCWALMMVGRLSGAPPADQLLPDATKGFLSIGSLETLDEHWLQSQFGRLVEDPAMGPFVEDVRARFDSRASAISDKLGLSLADLREVASGEVALALVRPAANASALALLADVTGREAEAEQMLHRMDRRLIEGGAGKQSEMLGQTRLTVYQVPRGEGQGGADTIAVFIHDQLLCAASDRSTAEGILARFAPGARGRLADLPAYRETMQRCRTAAGELAPDFRWFIEPFGFTYAYREMEVDKPRRTRRGKDLAEVLQRHGFDAIEGLGGYVNLHAERGLELLHRTAVYAPTERGAVSGSSLAMQLLQFPVGGDLLPQPWVPRDVATYASFNWNIQHAFDHVGPLADEFFSGEGNFATILEGIAEGEHGPKVNIRDEIVAHLGHRVTAVTDYELPITPKSERFLFTVQSTNDEALADAIRRLMETDKWRRRHDFEGRVVWETVEDPIDDPVHVRVEDDEDDEDDDDDFVIDPFPARRTAQKIEPRKPPFPGSAIMVADGHLWIASHLNYLKRVIADVPPPGQQLTQTVDFNRVRAAISALAPETLSVRGFSRTDQEYRPTFELLRQGKMPQSETLLGRMLNEMLAEDDDLRPQKLDASKLPPFDEVEQYFGPAGLVVSVEETGWFIVGAMLSSEAVEVARRPE